MCEIRCEVFQPPVDSSRRLKTPILEIDQRVCADAYFLLKFLVGKAGGRSKFLNQFAYIVATTVRDVSQEFGNCRNSPGWRLPLSEFPFPQGAL